MSIPVSAGPPPTAGSPAALTAGPAPTGPLGLDPAGLVACVACGLCLPHCPTYRASGEEAMSPRGRIAAMRVVEAGLGPVDDEFVRTMDSCVQCRGCEPACPADVPFGRLMEATREAMAATPAGRVPIWLRLGMRALGHPALVVAGSRALAVAQRSGLPLPSRLGLPRRLPLHQPRLRASGTDVWLFTGCVMDAWQRDVHRAAQRVLEAAGVGVAVPGAGAGCCGALHVHTGLGDQARALARRTMAALPGPAPVLVDSAGCGAALKDYGHLLGTPEAEAFSARVFDVHEWLAERVERLPAPGPGWRPPVVAVQDPCHLRHVQHAAGAVRTVLAPYASLRELDDEGLCCGAGGAYAALHPGTAGDIRTRKLAALARSGAPTVVSANPGCSLHLAAAGVSVRHPIELVDEAIRAGRSARGR